MQNLFKFQEQETKILSFHAELERKHAEDDARGSGTNMLRSWSKTDGHMRRSKIKSAKSTKKNQRQLRKDTWCKTHLKLEAELL